MSEILTANRLWDDSRKTVMALAFPIFNNKGGPLETIEIEIINWVKYNPRTDRAKHSWIRLENTHHIDPKLFGLTAVEKYGWVCLLAEASRQSNSEPEIDLKKMVVKIDPEWFKTIIECDDAGLRQAFAKLQSKGLISILHPASIDQTVTSGDQTVTSGDRAVSTGITTLRNGTYSTIPSVLSTKHTTLKETVRNEAPCNAAPHKVNAFEARFSTAYQERDLRESIFRRYPIKKGWVASWPLIRALLVGSKDQDQLVRDMTVAADNFTAEMKRLKRAEDKIMSFQNWIKDGHWQEYINPEKSESFADDKPSGGDGWMEKAQKVLAMIRTYGDWTKYESEVRASLGDELWRTAIKARTNELRQIPNGPFQIPTFVKLLKNAHDGMEKSLPGTAG